VANGTDLKDIYEIDDIVFEVDNKSLTNRPDLWGHYGIAREFAALAGRPLKPLDVEDLTEFDDLGKVDLKIEDPLCYRYSCLQVENIKRSVSPVNMRIRLFYCGMRAINFLADLTNYLMLEMGQPMHAFDSRKVGKIRIKRFDKPFVFKTLDGVERNIDENTLMICNDNTPVAIAGIMGGLDSEIEEDTATVLVESANFNGDAVRKASAFLKHRTEASGRFEKGIDPNLAKDACDRFCYLVELLGAGTVLTGDVDVYPEPAKPVVTRVRVSRINKVIGIELSGEQMCEYLKGLDIETELDGDIITCTAPTVRQDLNIEEDYIEEVARMYGYDRIPGTLPEGSTAGGLNEYQKFRTLAKDTLRAMGFSEIMTYSFVSPSSVEKVNAPADPDFRNFVKLINPLGEDTSVMRTMILPNLLGVLYTNYSRSIPAVRMYELGNTFVNRPGEVEEGLPLERNSLCFGMFGEGEDFYSAKGAVSGLLRQLGIEGAEYEAESSDGRFHPGRCARVVKDGVELGRFGQIHPDVCAGYGIDAEVYGGEFNFELFWKADRKGSRYTPLPKFPAMTRDFAMVVAESVPVGKLEKTIRQAAGELLEDVKLFDVYRGAPVPPGSKSVAFTLSYRAADRTLKEAEVNEINSGVLSALREGYNAILREM
ncbi:MAG: phenylalanine--tRNA ligase subunit beta, partial [Firmicutes bacterium]|nr:phenylalanine--tRNA ligase subunit beta [Bacillota bacterium]